MLIKVGKKKLYTLYKVYFFTMWCDRNTFYSNLYFIQNTSKDNFFFVIANILLNFTLFYGAHT